MPSRNIIKVDAPNSYYHVYARGINKQDIFCDNDDYATFLNLFKRYLSTEQVVDNHKDPYLHLYKKIDLVSYCIMQNHFHLLLFQIETKSMEKLMRGIMTSYSRYHNKKYDRRGPLFESRYKASLISNQEYLEHIVRYIILNPERWQTYRYSCLPYYMGKRKAEWFNPEPVMSIFNDKAEFVGFLKDYEGHKKMLDEIKYYLANDTTT